MKTPASIAAGPMVGANCHAGIAAVAIGWLKLGPMGAGGIREGYCAEERIRDHTNTRENTQVQGPCEEVKPLLLPVSLSLYKLG